MNELTARIILGAVVLGVIVVRLYYNTKSLKATRESGVSWKESEHQVTLVIISRLRNLARRLIIPGDKYGAARRLLRDKIGEHTIQFEGGLDLGGSDREKI